MNYQELQAKMVDLSHRKDMGTRIPGFIEDARDRLQLRLGLTLTPFVEPTDTNEILEQNWLLYFYPAMKSLYEFIIEMETALYYERMYEGQVDQYFITRQGTTPLTITPECPAP